MKAIDEKLVPDGTEEPFAFSVTYCTSSPS
jgi:hypothetical protein